MKKILLLVAIVAVIFTGCPESLESPELVAINVTPNKVVYKVGESVAPSDVEVVATYGDGTTKAVSNYAISPVVFSAVGKVSVAVIYSENNAIKTATYEVTVTNEDLGGVPVENANMVIDGVECLKTSEKVVIPKGSFGFVTGGDYFSTYYKGTDDSLHGVFITDRNIKLSPFSMSKYEVTQQLYEAVTGDAPSWFFGKEATGEVQALRPVEQISWYDAVAFCNTLTEKLGIKDENGKIDYAYYVDKNYKTPYMTGTDVYFKQHSKGYRLPTEAEWEFAARGGDPSLKTFFYSFAGFQTTLKPSLFYDGDATDNSLDVCGWYIDNSSDMTHEVGLKEPNSLGLYDMSGNVTEWCWDWYHQDLALYDNSYIIDGVVIDPAGPVDKCYERVIRGGDYSLPPYFCAVSMHHSCSPDGSYKSYGFRICRSL